MKLKAIATYQYVRFHGANHNFIAMNDVRFPGLKIELLKEGAIRVKSDKDCILVFPTNVAYAIELTKDNEKGDTPSRGALLDVDPADNRK